MADLYEVLNDAAQKIKPPRVWPKILGAMLATTALVGFLVFFGSILYRESYNNKVYPGVYVGRISLGGLTKEEVTAFIENVNNRIAKEGIVLEVRGEDGAVHSEKLSTIVDGDNGVQLIQLDSTALAEAAFALGRPGGWQNYFAPILLKTGLSKHLVAPVITAPAIREVLTGILAPYEDAPHNAKLAFPNKRDLSNYTVVKEESGKIIDKNALIKTIQSQLGELSLDPVAVVPQEFLPTVFVEDVEKKTSVLPQLFAAGDIELNYVDAVTKARHDWKIAPSIFADWLDFRKSEDGSVKIGLNREQFEEYLDRNVRPITDTPAENAKFVMEEGRVKEFSGSKNGFGVNAEKTYQDVDRAFTDRAYTTQETVKTISITLDVTEPDIKTADVNTLGISEVLGVGVSSFRGSPTNRIKNITTAVKRLNGVLVPPGQEFSANKYAGPYTPENGFLPELVIKGNRIKKEVGGGMCQIGTTLFRMAMNSGFPITERHNHSLVVNYYSDPVNGNPGTDATLYDPLLDFKFLNDTNSHILIQTSVDLKKQELVFTLWGQSDGRKGWYTHPTVSKWIPAGESREIVDVDGEVKPGTKECQHAYTGAVASFTYSRVTPTGEKIDRVFDSYYRPLPEICILGEGYTTSTSAGNLGEAGN